MYNIMYFRNYLLFSENYCRCFQTLLKYLFSKFKMKIVLIYGIVYPLGETISMDMIKMKFFSTVCRDQRKLSFFCPISLRSGTRWAKFNGKGPKTDVQQGLKSQQVRTEDKNLEDLLFRKTKCWGKRLTKCDYFHAQVFFFQF